MELLYIWIKKYNNIKEEGFNFSPRYWFKFDEKTNTLTCEKGKPELAGIFDDSNIVNVTAIIGENGTGKSSLLEFLRKFDRKRTFIAVFRRIEIEKNGKEIVLDYDKEIYKDLVFLDKINLKSIISSDIVEDIEVEPNLIRTIFYCPILEGHGTYHSTQENHYIDISSNCFFGLIDEGLGGYKLKNTERQLNLLLYAEKHPNLLNLNQLLKTINMPNVCDIGIEQLEWYSGTFNNIIQDLWKQINNKYKEKIVGIFFSKMFILFFLRECQGANPVAVLEGDKKTFEENLKQDIDIIQFVQEFLDNFSWLRDNEKIGIAPRDIKNVYNELISYIENTEFEYKRIQYEGEYIGQMKLEQAKNLIGIYNKFNNILKQKMLPRGSGELFTFNWRNMSSGEKAFLNLYSRLWYAREKLHESDKFVYLLIDEGEMGFHPKWQKAYLNNIIKFVKVAFEGKTVQIIMTSHSPFLVSDLPRENVIFLEKDCNNKCKVAEPNLKRTFAENIHTLLANSFFMDNGLLGEFAREKIRHIIDLMDKGEIKGNEDYIEAVIECIGEPILRHTLQKKYDRVTFSAKNTNARIKELEAELKALKEKPNDKLS